MNASHDLIAVFGGIFGLLAVFSLIGAGLKYRVARGEPHGVIDNLNATYGAVEQLINAGHRHIGIIVGPLDISTANERMVGYRRALEDYGINIETGPRRSDGQHEELIQIGRYDFESGYRQFNNFMDMENPPTALCVTNYDMTMGAVTAAHERNIILGKDIGFVGFDAVDLCRIVSPPLSIVEQPTQLMGQKAGEIMAAVRSSERSPWRPTPRHRGFRGCRKRRKYP